MNITMYPPQSVVSTQPLAPATQPPKETTQPEATEEQGAAVWNIFDLLGLGVKVKNFFDTHDAIDILVNSIGVILALVLIVVALKSFMRSDELKPLRDVLGKTEATPTAPKEGRVKKGIKKAAKGYKDYLKVGATVAKTVA